MRTPFSFLGKGWTDCAETWCVVRGPLAMCFTQDGWYPHERTCNCTHVKPLCWPPLVHRPKGVLLVLALWVNFCSSDLIFYHGSFYVEETQKWKSVLIKRKLFFFLSTLMYRYTDFVVDCWKFSPTWRIPFKSCFSLCCLPFAVPRTSNRYGKQLSIVCMVIVGPAVLGQGKKLVGANMCICPKS